MTRAEIAMGFGMISSCVGGSSAAGTETQMAQAPAGFWETWGDGRAELSGYRLTTPRYGELRRGYAVLIFVTEDFTEEQRVKSDGGHGDEYPVLKLNEVRHFQTGIYDYSLLTSSFVRLDGQAPLGLPVKVSMSMQEWCGHVHETLLPRSGKLEWHGHSYFDGEGDHSRILPMPSDGVLLDSLPILVRDLVGALAPATGTIERPALPTLHSTRFAHVDPAWGTVSISRNDTPHTVTVPAGDFVVVDVTTRVGAVTTIWQVEASQPRRLIRWERSDGELAEMTGSARRPYWSLHAEGDERTLAELGLQPLTRIVDPP